MTHEEFIRWVTFEMMARFGDVTLEVLQQANEVKHALEFKRNNDGIWELDKCLF